jgi:hypothetical protein
MPEEQGRDDAGDQAEDEVRLAEVRPTKALRPDDLADRDGGRNSREHEHTEDVREPAEPFLAAEPGELVPPVDRGDHRHHDRGQQDEEAPEDECVHEARDEAPQELALSENDL